MRRLSGYADDTQAVAVGAASLQETVPARRSGCRSQGKTSASTSHFHIAVSTFTRITDRGHPWRMPFPACHYRLRAPAILKARRSCLYMAPRARHVPGSMPSSNARTHTTAWGMRSKHLT